MWYLFSILAMFLFLLLFVVNFFFSMIYNVKDRKWFNLTQDRNRRKALLIDVFGKPLGENFEFEIV